MHRQMLLMIQYHSELNIIKVNRDEKIIFVLSAVAALSGCAELNSLNDAVGNVAGQLSSVLGGGIVPLVLPVWLTLKVLVLIAIT